MGKTREDMTAKQLEVIALQTRKAKIAHDRDELKTEWLSRAEEVGIDMKAQLQPATIEKNLENSATDAVSYAAAHLCERDSVVKKIDLLRVAIEQGTGKTDLKAIEPAIDKAVQSGELIHKGDFYTTPKAQEREREILAFESLGRDKLTSAIKSETINNALKDKTLNDDQRDLVTQVLTTKNRIMGVQGSAGTGKTTALKVVNEIGEMHDFKLVGLAPSASAAQELENTGISSQTLASLAFRGFAGLSNNSLIVLDEAGMVSAKDMHALLEAVTKSEARIVLIGDERQLKAIEAGRPFSQLQDAGMETVYLREIQRQREPQLKEAVRLASKREISASFQKLKSIENSIIQIKSQIERHGQIAQDYAKLTPDARSRTLILASTNRNRESINLNVRSYLGLEGKGQKLTTYSRKDLSKAQALRTVSYEVGDVVKAERDYKSLGLMKGDFAQVVDGNAGVVTLQRDDEQKIEWRPLQQPYFTVLIEHERELSVGDMVRITQNDHKLGLTNGERMCVIAIPDQDSSKKSEIILEKSDGNRISLDSDSPLYLDHGYCQTVHSAQGQTCERIMIEALANGGMVNESSYYVAISRATDEAIIYTDDIENLPDALIEIDEKSAALDLADIDPLAPEMELE
jgi:ATP-dependent exoDNAse (exonuclease V) alpha subunit